MNFYERLKKFRSLAKLTQREAAKRIGVHESTYRGWEYGAGIKGDEYYPKIAKAFGITLDELFGVSKEESVEEKLNRIVAITESIKKKV